MPGMVGAGFFRFIQVALLPIGAAGYVAAVPRLLNYSRRAGVSATVFASLYTRYMQHRLGTRPDEPAARLMAVMPNVSQEGFRLETAPTLVGHLLTGFVPRIYRYPYEGRAPMRHQATARTSYYDAALQRHLAGVDQLVVLGAGFDTRAFRLSSEDRVRCFEIDLPRTQAHKLAMLEKAGLSTRLATYVSADFETENWMEKLMASGFDPARPAFFLWEGVTMYLDRDSVEATLRGIAGTAPGSVVAFDYFARETIASRSPYMRYARATARFVGEPLTFGIDNTPPARKSAADFVGSFGLALEEHRNFGRETRRRSAPAGFVTAVVTPDVVAPAAGHGPQENMQPDPSDYRDEGKP
ncbi:methyltransferase, TIGR00027 family [Arthrobacter sp. ov407]|uniref:class I SAM-dependent methyltransferase n=1 Tax=Arthrobacter sp. ov407 TaxID=1761748 RepID=UPI000881CD05|nr:SAM-dependent methyltransferase [Arthrobacter sp. ov407]SDL16262.1 methyltransferase, TIGR00027 family [Arthrobacter sp. ov407]